MNFSSGEYDHDTNDERQAYLAAVASGHHHGIPNQSSGAVGVGGVVNPMALTGGGALGAPSASPGGGYFASRHPAAQQAQILMMQQQLEAQAQAQAQAVANVQASMGGRMRDTPSPNSAAHHQRFLHFHSQQGEPTSKKARPNEHGVARSFGFPPQMVSSAVAAGRFGSRGSPPVRGALGRDVFGSQPTGFLPGNHLMNSHLNPHNNPSFNSIPRNSIQQNSTENSNSGTLLAKQQSQNNAHTQKNDNPQNTTPSLNDSDQLSNKIKHIIFSNGRPEMPPPRWYNAVVPLGVDEDKYWLSELHTLLRKEFVEVFGTTQVCFVLII